MAQRSPHAARMRMNGDENGGDEQAAALAMRAQAKEKMIEMENRRLEASPASHTPAHDVPAVAAPFRA